MQCQASGDLGSTVIKSLLANGNFTVSVLIREASTCTFPADVKVVKTDYSPASLLAALQGQDAVVSTVGAAGVTSQIALIDAAEQAGVKRFIPSEFGHNFESEAAAIDSVVLMPKREVLVYLKEKAAQHPDFTYTPIATGPFLDWVSFSVVSFIAVTFKLSSSSINIGYRA